MRDIANRRLQQFFKSVEINNQGVVATISALHSRFLLLFAFCFLTRKEPKEFTKSADKTLYNFPRFPGKVMKNII